MSNLTLRIQDNTARADVEQLADDARMQKYVDLYARAYMGAAEADAATPAARQQFVVDHLGRHLRQEARLQRRRELVRAAEDQADAEADTLA